MTELSSALDRIVARRPAAIDLSLDRMTAALSRLGDPHLAAPPAFHIAGTNGKGSTLAFLRAMLEKGGRSVHVYTSPHLVRFNERIVLAGAEIDDATAISALERVDAAAGDGLTFFECVTAAAFLAFAETPADALLLETGLGGRLDATNVLPTARAAIIAPVDYDHQRYLGDTLREIAAEKAGIFRAGAPAVIGRQTPDAKATLCEAAARVGARPFSMGEDWDAYAERGRFVFQDERGLIDLDPPRLPGAHQIDNAGLAVAALRAGGVDLDDRTISEGIASAVWPGRLHRITGGPLYDRAARLAGAAPEIWLDGGHNPHAARALARAMADLEARSARPLALIVGMQGDKDAVGYFDAFSGIAGKVVAVASRQPGAMAAGVAAAAARDAGIDAVARPSLAAAIDEVYGSNDDEPPRLLIGGSLYLAGEVLEENG